MKKVFVTSVTGMQGAHIAKVFNKNGYEVSSMTRQDVSIDKANSVVGDFSEIEKLTNAMKNSKAIILTLPLIFDTHQIKTMTQQIVDAAKNANVNKIIFNSSIPLGDSKVGHLAIDVKFDALNILEKSALNIVTLMPTIYLENLISPFLLPIIKENSIVPYPITQENEFNWISYENLGRYCLAATEDDSIVGKKILISNQDDLSKQEIVDLIGKKLDKKLQYIPITPEQFEENLKPILGGKIATEIANLYKSVDKNSANFTKYTNQKFLNSINLQNTTQWADSLEL